MYGPMRKAPVALASLLCIFVAMSARADDSFDTQAWKFFSGPGAYLYYAAGVGLPLIEDGRSGKNHSLRIADAILMNELFTDGLKRLVQEKRPNSNSHDSFPSSHASTAFSIATVESALHPRQAPYWYAGATLIAASRAGLHRHTVGDVLAGSALGYAIGRWEMSSRRGLLLSPLIQPDSHVYGVSLRGSF